MTARLFSLSTGHVLWERTLIADIKLAHLTNPVYLGTDAAFTVEAERAVVILSDGQRVSKLSVANGTVLWSLEAPGVGCIFSRMLTRDTAHSS